MDSENHQKMPILYRTIPSIISKNSQKGRLRRPTFARPLRGGGRFAPLASLAAAQRGSLRSRWLAGEVLRATQCINVARFARCLAADLGGQTASEVIFDLRIELLDLNNHKIDTHIATIKRPWPPRS